MERKRGDWSIALVLNQHFISETTKVSSWVEANERQGSKQQSYFIWVSEKHFYTKYTTHRFTLDRQYLHKKRFQPSLHSLQHNTNSFNGKPRGEKTIPFYTRNFHLNIWVYWEQPERHIPYSRLTATEACGLMCCAICQQGFRNLGGRKHRRKLQLLFSFLFRGAWWNI